MKKVKPADPVNWSDFGQFIFSKREADPGYYILNYLGSEGGVRLAQQMRFAVAWCAFYNLGIAARASELQGDNFYGYLLSAYPTAKRASERRHFRGDQGLRALTQWKQHWPKPEKLAEHIMAGDMGAIRKNCDDVMQMGDYFKWKWGDLTEVLLQEPVNFRGYENKSPKVPQEGARLIATESGKPQLSTETVYLGIVNKMKKLGVRSAYSTWREFDVQDAETICCVYKQYRSGSYHPGLRTAKAAARLHHDGDGSKTAKKALQLLLSNQPVPEFADPVILNGILTGEYIYPVEDFL